MSDLRIVSFLPSGTELACSLGLMDQLVGISHECDFPPNIRGKPVVVHSALALDKMGLGEIDAAVAERLRAGASLYEVDENLLRELSPTHILTQNLCQVCAPAGNEVTRALSALTTKPEVLWMSPHSIEDIHNDLRHLARRTGRLKEAERRIASDHARLQRVAECVSRASRRPRVFCAEWIDPIYCCGHWVPELVEIAGGTEVLGRKWADSVRVKWEDIAAANPDMLIVMPCGFDLAESTAQAKLLFESPECAALPAVQQDRVYAVDAAYFSRPSLRVIDGTELLAHLLHPELFLWTGPSNAFRQIPSPPKNQPVGVLTKTCPVCSSRFPCGGASTNFDCWCASLPPLPALGVTEQGCLCPSCLAARIPPI
jgi:iron complex transport system substrate-binding protein